MNARRAATLLSLMFALSACSQSETPPAAAAAPPAAATQGTTTQQAGNPSVPVQQQPGATPSAPAPGPNGSFGPAGPNGQHPMDLSGINRALGAAVEASQHATGDTDCEKAYNGIVAMVEAMQKATGRAADPSHRPDRANFLRGCAELPPQIQQCMVISYGMQHQQECQAARTQLTPEMQARVQAIMHGNHPTPADVPSPADLAAQHHMPMPNMPTPSAPGNGPRPSAPPPSN